MSENGAETNGMLKQGIVIAALICVAFGIMFFVASFENTQLRQLLKDAPVTVGDSGCIKIDTGVNQSLEMQQINVGNLLDNLNYRHQLFLNGSKTSDYTIYAALVGQNVFLSIPFETKAASFYEKLVFNATTTQ